MSQAAEVRTGSAAGTEPDTALLSPDEVVTPDGARVTDVWSWAFSDGLATIVRQAVAEYLVARAVEADLSRPRRDTDTWDVVTPEGTTIEVMSAAHLDAYGRPRTGTVTWGRTRGGGRAEETPRSDFGAAARADLYVLCLQTATHRSQVDVVDHRQWEFYVLAREDVRHFGVAVGLRAVQDRARAVSWEQLGEAVRAATR
ncbi:hypothetical protein [Aquipuribacter nitratireducens]|uniref:Uncharacterized protein n=1 Tax=Aquipuribacter nitratireducens TaxID=650104 RepID=A0ABW0GHK8_9MICO